MRSRAIDISRSRRRILSPSRSRLGGSLPPILGRKKRGKEPPSEPGKGRKNEESERKRLRTLHFASLRPLGEATACPGALAPALREIRGGSRTKEPRDGGPTTEDGSLKIFCKTLRADDVQSRILGKYLVRGGRIQPRNRPTCDLPICVCTTEADGWPAFAPHGTTTTSEVLPTVSRPDGLLWAFVTFSGTMGKRCR